MEKIAELLRFLLIATGLLYILTRSAIGWPLRLALGKQSIWLFGLLFCPACLGFWLGFVLTPLWPWAFHRTWLGWIEAFQPAIAVCGLGSLLASVWPDTSLHELTELGYGRPEEEQND